MGPNSQTIRVDSASYIEQEVNSLYLEQGLGIDQFGLFCNHEAFDHYYDCA